jgi:hypothetical protein
LIQQRRQTSAVYYDLAINPYGGNVGIGTTSPATIFHISDATTPEVRIQDTTNNRYLSLYQNDSNSYIQSSLNSALVLSTHGANERMRITTAGNVGIGTTSPSQKLEVAGKLLVDNGDLGSVAGDTIYHAEITGTRHHLDFKEVRTANGSDWPNTTYKLQMRVDSTNHQSIDFVSDANSKEHIDIYTGNQIFNTRFDANGNVGIGTTSPSSPLTFGKSVYGGFDSEDFYRIKLQDQGGTHNDVGIGQTASGNMGFNITSGNAFIFNNGTSGEIARFNGTLEFLIQQQTQPLSMVRLRGGTILIVKRM